MASAWRMLNGYRHAPAALVYTAYEARPAQQQVWSWWRQESPLHRRSKSRFSVVETVAEVTGSTVLTGSGTRGIVANMKIIVGKVECTQLCSQNWGSSSQLCELRLQTPRFNPVTYLRQLRPGWRFLCMWNFDTWHSGFFLCVCGQKHTKSEPDLFLVSANICHLQNVCGIFQNA